MDARAVAATLQVPPTDLPLALARVHGTLGVGDRFAHSFTGWKEDALRRVVEGGGFGIHACTRGRGGRLRVEAVRLRTLPDFVAPDLRLLAIGLNPSIHAADAGVGFARPGNRFWPAALDAGLVTRDRDPWHAARVDRVGMTDLAKRATVGARDLAPEEYRAGLARVERLASWLQPGVVCFLGLAGWRIAVDRRATAGVQRAGLGGVPVYVMPNPSGLNTHATVDALAEHLRAALRLAEPGCRPG